MIASIAKAHPHGNSLFIFGWIWCISCFFGKCMTIQRSWHENDKCTKFYSISWLSDFPMHMVSIFLCSAFIIELSVIPVPSLADASSAKCIFQPLNLPFIANWIKISHALRSYILTYSSSNVSGDLKLSILKPSRIIQERRHYNWIYFNPSPHQIYNCKNK